MTDGELHDAIEVLRLVGSDHLDVEGKRAERGLPKRLWETLSAFANTPGGGIMILGVDEEAGFAATGVADAKKVQQDLASVCDDMVPPLRPVIRPHRFEGKVLLVAEIAEVPDADKPCYYRGAGLTNGAFVRVADGDRKLTPYEVQLLVAGRGQPRFDEEPVGEASIADLDGELVAALLAARRRAPASRLARLSDEEALRTLRVLVRLEGRLVPSLAGLLAAGIHPQRFFPNLTATLVVYPDTDVGAPGVGGERFLDNRRFEGPIATLVTEILEGLRRNMRRKTIVRGGERQDVWDYPEDALREAVVNALVHRDLSAMARGTPVQIQMFADRLVVVNPGGLHGPVRVENLGEAGVSAARNATLMQILEDLPGPAGTSPICENRGSGIGAMIAALRRAGLEPPRFEDQISTFRVRFPNHALLDAHTLDWLEGLGEAGLSDAQRMALALLRHGHRLDNVMYRQATSLDSRVATRELRDLVHRGLVVPVGTGRWTTYQLAPPRPRRRNRRDEIVELLREHGDLSRAEVARALRLSHPGARVWLSKLRDEGLVEMVGPARSPAVRYRLAPRKGRR